MKLQEIDITIRGTTPLICNRFTEQAAMSATNGTRAATVPNAGTPREQAEPKLYLDDEGNPAIPQPNIFRCLIDAGKHLKVGRSKVTTQANSMVPAFLSIQGLMLPLTTPVPWEVDIRPIVNPATKGRRLCYRPRFDEWALPFTAEVDVEQVTPAFMRELVDVAGVRIGLGDFRPDRKGPFGKFVVDHWDVHPLG